MTVGGQRINMCARSWGRRTGFQNANIWISKWRRAVAARRTYRGFYASTIILCNLYSIQPARRQLDSAAYWSVGDGGPDWPCPGTCGEYWSEATRGEAGCVRMLQQHTRTWILFIFKRRTLVHCLIINKDECYLEIISINMTSLLFTVETSVYFIILCYHMLCYPY